MMPSERDPARPLEAVPSAGPVRPIPIDRPEYRWYHKLSAVLLIALCLEIGLFLLAIPWTEYWENNYFSSLGPGWRQYWLNTYVRGAVSGLGVANLYVSLTEIFRLRRFAGNREDHKKKAAGPFRRDSKH